MKPNDYLYEVGKALEQIKSTQGGTWNLLYFEGQLKIVKTRKGSKDDPDYIQAVPNGSIQLMRLQASHFTKGLSTTEWDNLFTWMTKRIGGQNP